MARYSLHHLLPKWYKNMNNPTGKHLENKDGKRVTKISFVIPAYNEEKYIGPCLNSIMRELAGKNYDAEIIVVDNASTDDTAKVARSFNGVKVVHEPRKGPNNARQRGLEESTGNLIAYMDADTKMPRGWIEKVISAFGKDEELVCISGPYIYHDLTAFYRTVVRFYWVFLAHPAYLMTGYMAVGGNLAAKKSALLAVNGFDKEIKFYGDDTDIARRLSEVGKVKFIHNLYMYTSARRLRGEGMVSAGAMYVINFLSVVFIRKPITNNEYKDVR